MNNAPLTTLCFMTLWSFHAAGDETDFRGWNETFILIDSDVLAFLNHGIEAGEVLNWSVVGISGDRHLDILVFQRQNSRAETYFMPVSNVTGRMIGQWMQTGPTTSSRTARRLTASETRRSRSQSSSSGPSGRSTSTADHTPGHQAGQQLQSASPGRSGCSRATDAS